VAKRTRQEDQLSEVDGGEVQSACMYKEQSASRVPQQGEGFIDVTFAAYMHARVTDKRDKA